jgi:hypothetical protein
LIKTRSFFNFQKHNIHRASQLIAAFASSSVQNSGDKYIEGALDWRLKIFVEEDSTMNWTTLNFGKHRGKTLPQIIFDDADWFFWAYEEDLFTGMQAPEAREIYRRARAVRIPVQNGQKMLVEYRFEPRSGKFATMFLPSNFPVSAWN